MSMNYKYLCLICYLLASTCFAEPLTPQLGKPISQSADQIKWNLTIFPNGKNLPIGKGIPATGKQLFAQKCSGCHGPEGMGGAAEPLVGEVGSLTSIYPEKTVNSYWPYATTLFDYIRRAMPLDAPFSLSADEVYALSAYILYFDGIIEADFELNQNSLPKVKMPNRNGFISDYPSK